MIEASILSPNKAFYGDFHNMGHNFIAFIHDPDDRHLVSFICVYLENWILLFIIFRNHLVLWVTLLQQCEILYSIDGMLTLISYSRASNLPYPDIVRLKWESQWIVLFLSLTCYVFYSWTSQELLSKVFQSKHLEVNQTFFRPSGSSLMLIFPEEWTFNHVDLYLSDLRTWTTEISTTRL